MVQAGLIHQPKRAYCQITDRGLEALASGVTINNELLNNYPEFLDFKSRSKKFTSGELKSTGETEPTSEKSESTPEELIEESVDTLNANLKDEILQAILNTSPIFFENLVVDLMLAMGYGGSRKDAGKATRYTQDGGIDGIIKEDKLGLDTIYLQAKRYSNKTVGRPEVQSFAGALEMHKAKKGVFITTSRFTQDSYKYVDLIEKKIVLIDGEKLTDLMLDHDIGVNVKRRIYIKSIDSDYFVED